MNYVTQSTRNIPDVLHQLRIMYTTVEDLVRKFYVNTAVPLYLKETYWVIYCTTELVITTLVGCS